MFEEFLKKLNQKESDNKVFNPYKNEKILQNLQFYLEYLYKHNHTNILLIGEAPGYKGCRITGIPFTSSELFVKTSNIKIFNDLKEKVFLEKIEHENTATIIWEYLKNKNELPILWNSFPYHPFNINNPKSNRTPTNKEIEESKYFIKELVKIFNPKIIAAIGRKGEKVLHQIYPNKNIEYIRHPSYGGKKEFINGMEKIYKKINFK